MNLPVVDPANIVNFTKLRDQFAKTYEQWCVAPNSRALFPVLTQPKSNAKLAKESSRTSRLDRKSTRLNSSHVSESRMPSSA